MAVTLRDVARAAGVSPIAVSKVLHGKGGSARVSAEKAALIRQVADRLSYTPNTLARSLRGGKTRNIGLVFEELGPIGRGSRYLGLLLDGITTACFDAGYSVSICPLLAENSSYNIGDGRFDGIVWAKSNVEVATLQAARRAGVKVVHLHVPGSEADDPEGFYFCCDNPGGIRLALEHLNELGHRHVSFINESENANVAEAVVRAGLFRSISQELGMIPSQAVWTLEGAGIQDWFERYPEVTAVVLRTESLIQPLYQYAAVNGIAIPRDLSVIGFDSTEFCDYLNPRLTAIHQPIEQMALEATRTLIHSIESPESTGESFVFPCRLDIRESTTTINSRCRG